MSCDMPGCPNAATLSLAFTCAHDLCKVHEYFWSQAPSGETFFGNERAPAPEGARFGCSACVAGVPRRQTVEQAEQREKNLVASLTNLRLLTPAELEKSPRKIFEVIG